MLGTIIGKTDSIFKDILNYYKPASSPALLWGQYNEHHAISTFYKLTRRKHKILKILPCGVLLYNRNPILAAPPDALVSCSCFGIRALEMRNPYTQILSIPMFAKEPTSCLEITQEEKYCLIPTHPYYFKCKHRSRSTTQKLGIFVSRRHHFTTVCISRKSASTPIWWNTSLRRQPFFSKPLWLQNW